MQDSGINVFFQGINSLLLLKGLWTTLHISLLSAGLSIPLGILLGIFMTLKNPIARVVSQIYLEIVRIMPQLAIRCLFRIHSSLWMESLCVLECNYCFYLLGYWRNGRSGSRSTHQHSEDAV